MGGGARGSTAGVCVEDGVPSPNGTIGGGDAAADGVEGRTEIVVVAGDWGDCGLSAASLPFTVITLPHTLHFRR